MDDNNSQTVRTEFLIRDERKAWFIDKMSSLARRAARMGLEAPSYTFGPAFDKIEIEREEIGETDLGRPIYQEVEVVSRFWPTTMTGKAPRYAGWTLAATLQRLDENNVLVRSITETPAPAQYRNAATAADCAHCNAARIRKDTFLVVSDAGEWKQVGRQCIRDFLGHQSPEHIAWLAECIIEARGYAEAGGAGGGAERFPLDKYLAYVAVVMANFGWMSRTRARDTDKPATSGEAMNHMKPSKDLRRLEVQGKWKRLEPSAADAERGNAAMEWAANLSDQEVANSDYLFNLRTIARTGVLERTTAGYAASIIIAHDKALERVRERMARPDSSHVGTIGERSVFTVTQKIVFENDGHWGRTYIHIFVDAAGNELKWFGSGRLVKLDGEFVRDGETATIKATVKKHDEYKGRKQTVLSRCEVYVDRPKRSKRNEKIAGGFCSFVAFVVSSGGDLRAVA